MSTLLCFSHSGPPLASESGPLDATQFNGPHLYLLLSLHVSLLSRSGGTSHKRQMMYLEMATWP